MKNKDLLVKIGVVIVFLIFVQMIYSIPAPYKWMESAWSAGDLLSFIGTISLGIVTVYQSKRANEISLRLLQLEEEREKPQIDLLPIKKEQLKLYNKENFIISHIESDEIYIDLREEQVWYDENSIWFEIKNMKNSDIVEIFPLEAMIQIQKYTGETVTLNRGALTTIYCRRTIPGGSSAPFFLRLNEIWIRVAKEINQTLLLSITFELVNLYGERYSQKISLNLINAYVDTTLTPTILRKNISPSERMQ